MAEYTYKDIIIDPNSEEAKNAVGKICYFSDSPRTLLSEIDCKRPVEGILTNMDDGYFEVDNEGYWDCIILKKEEPKPKYVPFESTHEFISAYYKANNEIVVNTESMLSGFGMWLRCKENFESNARPFLACVSEIYDDCITIGKYPDPITFKGLLEYCEFLDGSPCGKEVKDE